MGEVIMLDDDDDVQCLGESPAPTTRTPSHGTAPTTHTPFKNHTRNTSKASNTTRAGPFHNRNTSHSSNHNRTIITTPPPKSPSAKSEDSSSSTSSKRRKIQQVNDGRAVQHLDYDIQNAFRAPDEPRTREDTADAPSPRSSCANVSANGSVNGSANGSVNGSSPKSPTRQPVTPAHSITYISSSGGPSNGTSNTLNTTLSLGGSTVSTLRKSPQLGVASPGAPIPFPFEKSAAKDSFSLPHRAASNVSKSSNASSGLSDPPESRNVSFATFQNNLRFGGASIASSNNSNSSRASSGLNSPPQSDRGSLKINSPPRLGRLTLEEVGFPREIIELADDSDDEIQITKTTNNGWGREDSPLGIPYAFQQLSERRQGKISEANGIQRASNSHTPPKRKRDEAFSTDDDESGSQYTPAGSSRGSSRSGSALRSVRGSPENDRDIIDLEDEFVPHRISPGSGLRRSGSAPRAGAPRFSPGQEPVTVIIDDDVEEVLVDLADNAELDEEDEYTGGEDEDDLPENPVFGLGNRGSPISVGDEEDDEIEFVRSKNLAPAPRLSVVAAARRRSTIIPRRSSEIVHPWEDIGSIIHKGWELKKGTFLEVKDPLCSGTTTFLLINHVILNNVTGNITIRGHKFQRTREVGFLKKTRNELCRMLEVDEDDARDPLVQGQIEVELEACICKPRQINITNRLFGEPGGLGTCTWRNVPRPPALKRAIQQVKQEPDFRGEWDDKFKGLLNEAIEEMALLACRWELIRFWPTAKERMYGPWHRGNKMVLQHIQADDPYLMGPNVRQDASLVRDQWRGKGATVLGGSYIPGGDLLPSGFFRLENEALHKVRVKFNSILRNEEFSRIENTFSMDLTSDNEQDIPYGAATSQRGSAARLSLTIDLTDRTAIPHYGSIRSSMSSSSSSARSSFVNVQRHSGPVKRRLTRKYTYGDAFCGAGGATRGAFMANLKVVWGFDLDTHACRSWHRNFPSAAVYEMDAYTACNLPGINFRCDILHMSPPCQYFSPAHTVAGKDDEINTAALFAIGPLLQKVKPRIATLEETAGLKNGIHAGYFRALINMICDLGYSVKWKVCQLANWGLPQRRDRLIIFCAAPGETLPEFPDYTHSRNPHGYLRPWAAAGPLIDSIPRDSPDHDLASVLVYDKYDPDKAWDATSICPRTMTCSGGQNYHYSGMRNLTNREFVAIQGFPMEHLFASKHVKKQIGNAVPPMIAKLLFEACRKALEETDGVEKEVICLDDD